MRWRILALAVLLALAIGCENRLSTPAVIEGLSMAPTLWGEHLSTRCGECSFVYACDRTSTIRAGTSVCPNCGFAGNAAANHMEKPAQQYSVVGSLREARRWDIVAFRYPAAEARAGEQGVKRIVGLPGETIRFRDGLIWVNGEVAAMDWSLVQATRLLVYDSRFNPPSHLGLPDRMTPRTRRNGWAPVGNLWDFSPAGLDPDQLYYLDYVHWRCCRHAGERTTVHPVEDYHPNDQSISRTLQTVDQLAVSVEFSMESSGVFEVTLWRPTGSWVARVDRGRNRVELRLGRMEATIVEIDRASTNQAKLELSTIGGRLHAAWNGRLLGEWIDLTRLDEPPPAASERRTPEDDSLRPTPGATVVLAAGGGKVLVKELQIYRGLHYFDEAGGGDGPGRSYSLGPDEYFLVGDNVANSIDSRHWKSPGLPRKYLIGSISAIPVE